MDSDTKQFRRDMAEAYANLGEGAIVIKTDGRGRAIGRIANVTGEGFTVKKHDGSEEALSYDDVAGIAPVSSYTGPYLG